MRVWHTSRNFRAFRGNNYWETKEPSGDTFGFATISTKDLKEYIAAQEGGYEPILCFYELE